MNELESASQIFAYSDNMVRTLEMDGEPWFVAKDIASILGFSQASDITKHLDDDEKGKTNCHTLGGNQIMQIINESGLYHAIFQSRKEEAQTFRRWVTGEVLPAIRRAGGYFADGGEIGRARKEAELARIREETAFSNARCRIYEEIAKGKASDALKLSALTGRAVSRSLVRRSASKPDHTAEIAVFCDKFCDVTGRESDWMKLAELYGVYKEWTKGEIIKRQDFERALGRICDGVEFRARRPDGIETRTVFGMKLKEGWREVLRNSMGGAV